MKLLYKPFGMVFGIVGGLVGSTVFTWLWKLIGRGAEAPKATSAHHGWAEVLVAASIQGAVFGVAKAAIDRAGATAYRRATGVWPGED